MNVNSSSGPTLQYSVSNSGTKSYCITATIKEVSYFYSSTTGNTIEGYCTGHSPPIYKTASGWNAYPIPWSSGADHGYGPYYGAYYPSTLRADNSGSLTLFNPHSISQAQDSVTPYFWCRNTSTNAISSTITGTAFAQFNSSAPLNTITWSCAAGSVLYALTINSTNPGTTPDSFTGTVKSRTWYSSNSPNFTASQTYVLPQPIIDTAGWVTMPIPWGSGTNLGYGPYYAVFIDNNPAKTLAITQTGTLQLYNPYAASRSQGGVILYYWCKDSTSGLVRSYSQVPYATFIPSAQTNEVNWSCPANSKLFAAHVGGSAPTNYYPNELASKIRFWWSGESISVYPAYLDSVRTMHGE